MEETMAQIGLYAHRGLDGQASSNNQGDLNSCLPLPRLHPRDYGRPEGSAEEDEKIFWKTR